MLIIILVIQLTGCAAMFHGSNDQVTVTSGDPDAKLYVDATYLGKGSGTTFVKRNTIHTVFAKKNGCADGIVQTQTSFDSVSLLGILIDFGVISMLVVDWGATGAMWKTDPLLYSVTPNCDTLEQANLGRAQDSFSPVQSRSENDKQLTPARQNKTVGMRPTYKVLGSTGKGHAMLGYTDDREGFTKNAVRDGWDKSQLIFQQLPSDRK
jgi:hypothetical protein